MAKSCFRAILECDREERMTNKTSITRLQNWLLKWLMGEKSSEWLPSITSHSKCTRTLSLGSFLDVDSKNAMVNLILLARLKSTLLRRWRTRDRYLELTVRCGFRMDLDRTSAVPNTYFTHPYRFLSSPTPPWSVVCGRISWVWLWSWSGAPPGWRWGLRCCHLYFSLCQQRTQNENDENVRISRVNPISVVIFAFITDPINSGIPMQYFDENLHASSSVTRANYNRTTTLIAFIANAQKKRKTLGRSFCIHTH